jgi:hypothetical protein
VDAVNVRRSSPTAKPRACDLGLTRGRLSALGIGNFAQYNLADDDSGTFASSRFACTSDSMAA